MTYWVLVVQSIYLCSLTLNVGLRPVGVDCQSTCHNSGWSCWFRAGWTPTQINQLDMKLLVSVDLSLKTLSCSSPVRGFCQFWLLWWSATWLEQLCTYCQPISRRLLSNTSQFLRRKLLSSQPLLCTQQVWLCLITHTGSDWLNLWFMTDSFYTCSHLPSLFLTLLRFVNSSLYLRTCDWSRENQKIILFI